MTRRRLSRRTARVLLVDERSRLLLFHDSDLGAGARMWITPGGGVEPGESDREAAARELAEETGLLVDPDALVGPLARRTAWHGYSDKVVEQEEVFFSLRVVPFEVDDAGHTDDERLTMTEHRWWSRDSLASYAEDPAHDPLWPADVLAIWDRVESGATDCLDLGTTEESTVPVD